MKPIHLDLPGAEIVFMTLYDSIDPSWLDQDLLFVRLADGSKVEGGWYGTLGKGGCFRLVRYKHSWHAPLGEVKTDNIQMLVNLLEIWAISADHQESPMRVQSSSSEAPPVRFQSSSMVEYHPVSWVA